MERFQLKTAISFGNDALAALEELAGQRVMVITDDFLARSGLLDQVLARLKGCTVEKYTDVVPDPPLEGEQILCPKKGVVTPAGSCRSFRYDPLKRVPPLPTAPDFSALKDEDFKL